MHELLIRMSARKDEDYRYSSAEGRAVAKKILKFIKYSAYESSIELAKELGPFPAFDYEGFAESKFIQQLIKERPDLGEAMKEHGIANVTVLTQAPTGTTGTATGYSSGCEPYFSMAYIRNSNVGSYMDGCPSFREWLDDKGIDFADYDYSLRELRRRFKRVPKYFEEAQDIRWEDHLAMQAVFAEQVDSSVSKTINLPSDATVGDIMDSYISAYDLNIKSTTVYRDGSKAQILETLKSSQKSSKNRPQTVMTVQSPVRGETLGCDIHTVSVKGQKWKVLVGLLHGKPYETFCFPEEQIEIPSSKTVGTMRRAEQGKYDLSIGEEGNKYVIKNIASLLLNDEHRMVTRLLSANLRHGTPLSAVVGQLSKCEGDITAFSKAMMRVLRKYISDEEYLEISRCHMCGSANLILNAGCLECADCGTSACE
jgi:ribonucleoside-diphosphate reductase alpha chain